MVHHRVATADFLQADGNEVGWLMIYTIILSLYVMSGAAICIFLIACFTHTEKIEEISGEDTVRMVPPHKALIVSAVLSMFAVIVGAAVMLAWPVLLLILGMKK